MDAGQLQRTMPELPSPLGLSFLERFMDAYIIAPYGRLGSTIPEGLSSVRVLHGRPYLNVTLFYCLVVQLYGNPAFLTEQMGGDPLTFNPPVRPLGPLALLRAGFVMMREWRKVTTQAPRNFFHETAGGAVSTRSHSASVSAGSDRDTQPPGPMA